MAEDVKFGIINVFTKVNTGRGKFMDRVFIFLKTEIGMKEHLKITK